MARTNQQFTTIRTEGALLPPDILQRISAQKVDGMRPGDYHLPEGFKTTEAITQAWDMLKKHWKSFQEAREHLAENDTGTALTNERWLLPLFQQLGYGRLTTQPAPVIEERSYPIERIYNNSPIHLIGCNLHLDRRTKGARGAATASPHSMVQEYLNRSDDHLWAFLSNGRQLRLLRDNVALSRQAYVEFDLEAMMEGEVYSDFALLWILCHQSRLEAEKIEECWLEKWSKLAQEEGTRVLENLREGVRKAIEALGQGFIAHPQNDALRRKLQEEGSLTKDDFYRQLLRIVYRLLFLFVAEDRELLHPTEAGENAKELYQKYYSTSRLRGMSRKLRGSKHSDLWHSLSLVFSSLGKPEGCPQLGLIGLGSFLWKTENVADLAGPHEVNDDSAAVQISNDNLLRAIRALAYVEQDHILRDVDYRNLGSEELGSVYESLLELHPDMHIEARHFELRTAAGNERKTTGSYYTPDSLVQCLLDSALDPVVADRLKGKRGVDAEAAILGMTVCDPACGSGHFLIAAAHRLARHLARVRTGESEPSPEDHQHALRDVIGRCIYGVDINPMAVELCKVSLWMEAIEPGKPLSFLDHHIQCGNSLLGTTPRLLSEGIPDDAFKPIEGDVKAVCAELKRDNKKQRKDRAGGQRQNYMFEPYFKLGNLTADFSRLTAADDDTAGDVAEKERRYAELVSGADYQNARLLADTWCAAFVWKKDSSDLSKMCPTERDFRNIENNPHSILPHVKSEVRRLADQYQFFHWHLAFPDVFRLPGDGKAENEQTGWNDGFDAVLGNPPWERIKIQEDEWFAASRPDIATARTAAARRRLIEELEETDPQLFAEFKADERYIEGTNHVIRDSARYPLCARGEINTYSIFAELNVSVVDQTGRVGCILQAGIATDKTTRFFFEDIVSRQVLHSLYSFDNKEKLFPAVKPSTRFCLITIGGVECTNRGDIPMVFYAQSVADAFAFDRQFTLTARDIAALNPNTRTCPVFRSRRDATLVAVVYRRVPVIVNELEDSNEWELFVRRVFDMNKRENTDACVVAAEVEATPDDVPMYEAKLVDQFNHRKQKYVQGRTADFESCSLSNPFDFMQPRYWIPQSIVESRLPDDWSRQWLLTWQDVTDVNTMARTVNSAVLPRNGTDFTLRVGFPCFDHVTGAVAFVSGLNSYVFDYVSRQMIGGIHLSDYILKQLPLPTPDVFAKAPPWEPDKSATEWVTVRVLELTYTAWDLEAFALDCGYAGPPFRWDEERRFLLRCELDAAYFHLYLGPPSEWGTDSPQLREMFPTPRDAVDYIMETFPIVKRKDIARTAVKNAKGEVTQDGTYITKETILTIYDEMQQAIDTGQPYQTKLNPPPGPPSDAEGNFLPMSEWAPNNWPSHVHAPRETETYG